MHSFIAIDDNTGITVPLISEVILATLVTDIAQCVCITDIDISIVAIQSRVEGIHQLVSKGSTTVVKGILRSVKNKSTTKVIVV